MLFQFFLLLCNEWCYNVLQLCIFQIKVIFSVTRSLKESCSWNLARPVLFWPVVLLALYWIFGYKALVCWCFVTFCFSLHHLNQNERPFESSSLPHPGVYFQSVDRPWMSGQVRVWARCPDNQQGGPRACCPFGLLPDCVSAHRPHPCSNSTFLPLWDSRNDFGLSTPATLCLSNNRFN